MSIIHTMKTMMMIVMTTTLTRITLKNNMVVMTGKRVIIIYMHTSAHVHATLCILKLEYTSGRILKTSKGVFMCYLEITKCGGPVSVCVLPDPVCP